MPENPRQRPRDVFGLLSEACASAIRTACLRYAYQKCVYGTPYDFTYEIRVRNAILKCELEYQVTTSQTRVLVLCYLLSGYGCRCVLTSVSKPSANCR